jgi:hypothetical protein
MENNIIQNIPVLKSELPLFTESGLKLSNKYQRVLFTSKGNFVEFNNNDIIYKSFYINRSQLFRISDPRVYYVQFNSNDTCNIKMYYQLRNVRYADFNIGCFYISINDLFLNDGTPCEIEKPKNNENFQNFFEYLIDKN